MQTKYIRQSAQQSSAVVVYTLQRNTQCLKYTVAEQRLKSRIVVQNVPNLLCPCYLLGLVHTWIQSRRTCVSGHVLRLLRYSRQTLSREILRNSDVAIQNLQVSCLPFKTDNFIHVAQNYVFSTCSETDQQYTLFCFSPSRATCSPWKPR